MPDLRLSVQEAADVAEFLAQQTGGKTYDETRKLALDDTALVGYGETLVKNYGCFGCHLVEGFEQTPGIGAELSEFGIKTTDRLDFGDYITDHNQQTWDAWLFNKLEHPRVYAYDLLPWQQGKIRDGKAVMRMPQFDLTDDEIRSVMVVLKGMRGRDDKEVQVLSHELSAADKARERGRELVRFYNCYGCHRVDGFEGDIGQLAHLNIKQGNGKYGPPILEGQGNKTQPDWLFSFLKRPFIMRPLPQVRMPTFGMTDAEATDLVAMFSALDGAEYPFRFYADVAPHSDVDRAVGEMLFKVSNCQQCHIVGEVGSGPLPETVVAPSLLLTKRRLRAEWLNRWLADPGSLQEGTAMPPVWTGRNPLELAIGNTSEGQALLAQFGDDELAAYRTSRERQIEAVKNYLFILQPPGAPATAAAPAPARPTAAGPPGTRIR
jgi:mono/diheme cytochrome c family protein